jgi:hypothetical protein
MVNDWVLADRVVGANGTINSIRKIDFVNEETLIKNLVSTASALMG